MGYMHIDNLYKDQTILAFKKVFALEKIHGTSAHLSLTLGGVGYFSGGESHDRFVKLFDADVIRAKFAERFGPDDHVMVYGEAYGGKQQGMSATYGKELRFVAFDVKVRETWLAVPQAEEFVEFLGLEFVPYEEIPADMDAIDAQRDRRSMQALLNGITDERIREGIVLRPPFEVTLNNGKRIIAKHKRAEFSERGTPKVEMDPTKREAFETAESVALEWVTPMRLEHVIDRMIRERENKNTEMRDTGTIIKLMIEDVTREGSGEIPDHPHVSKAIGARAAKLFKDRVSRITEVV